MDMYEISFYYIDSDNRKANKFVLIEAKNKREALNCFKIFLENRLAEASSLFVIEKIKPVSMWIDCKTCSTR